MITNSIPPLIKTKFDKYLLLSQTERCKHIVEEIITPLSLKKIRLIDVGKKREFEKLLYEFMELYERKKNEEEIENKKTKEKMSHFPIKGTTCTFKRFEEF